MLYALFETAERQVIEGPW